MADVKVIVDCSGGLSNPVAESEVQGRVLALMREGQVDEASRVLAEFEASRSRVSVVPLTNAEVAQRVADALVDMARQVEERRVERDRLLSASDWTQGTDSPLDGETIEAWRDYRRELRDLDYRRADVTWPVPPS